MKPFILSIFIMTVLCNIVSAQQADNGKSYSDKYGVLTDRNMFLRNRTRPRPSNATSRPSDWRSERNNASNDKNNSSSPDRILILRGVVIEDNQLRAYIENSKTGVVTRVAPGDALASGTVGDIAIDAMQYTADGRSVWIEVGRDLHGELHAAPATIITTPPIIPPTIVPPTVATTDATTQPADGSAPAAPPVDISGLSIEEQMKMRRKLQLNK